MVFQHILHLFEVWHQYLQNVLRLVLCLYLVLLLSFFNMVQYLKFQVVMHSLLTKIGWSTALSFISFTSSKSILLYLCCCLVELFLFLNFPFVLLSLLLLFALIFCFTIFRFLFNFFLITFFILYQASLLRIHSSWNYIPYFYSIRSYMIYSHFRFISASFLFDSTSFFLFSRYLFFISTYFVFLICYMISSWI